jgi:hypothetical protein
MTRFSHLGNGKFVLNHGNWQHHGNLRYSRGKNKRIHTVLDELKIVKNYGFWEQGSEIKRK